MGAPLTTDKGMLGAIGLGSTHTEITFTHQQMELLRSIAKLTASAIGRLQHIDSSDDLLQTTEPEDQELADRLQQMAILNKVDEQINNRQALGDIMTLTLQVCMDYTKAGAGMIALRDQGELRSFISLGYPDGFRPGNHLPVPERMAELKATMERGEPARYDDISTQAPIRGLHPNSRSLLSVPIKYDDKPAGAILLEALNPSVFTTQHLTFIRRVMDHASVAITCAKLESELRATERMMSQLAASLSQSIKNPLLAIRDSAESLLTGSLGEINEDQHNGLHIIRSSVDQIAKHLLELARVRSSNPED
jgi:GAF domain-containing protein